jgi:3alpha(or 20beta)-hydroxysteroid dehydrogenase
MGAFDTRVAVVTGAARGQGLAEARLFVAEGASVVLVDVLGDLGRQAAQELGAGALFVEGDVASGADWTVVVDTATAAFGGVDVLVNNAGVHVNSSFDNTSEELFRRVLDTNLMGAFLGMKAVVPEMRKRGGGTIVSTASAAAFKAIPLSSAYIASKFALRGLTRAAALELGPDRIRVNCVCPGLIRTAMSERLLQYHEEEIVPTIPLRRVGKPEDVAELVLFLASEAAGFITGVEYLIDGGSMA